MPVSLCVDSKGQGNEHSVSTVDLSNNGVRVCAKAGLLPGQAVAIVTNSGQECSLPGRVVWIGPVGTRLEGQAGIEFLKPVSPPT
ncbi:MAG: PilZ domain-containing protein [Acidobacteriia bacterium]|nr:PilZ domain-containing protein [Terriglobia bacterium]